MLVYIHVMHGYHINYVLMSDITLLCSVESLKQLNGVELYMIQQIMS